MNADLDTSRSRLIGATKQVIAGLRLQRTRILDAAAEAPRLLEGTPHEVVNLTDAPDCDLTYYVYELARLQDLARTTIRIFEDPPEIVTALATFDGAIPHLRKARNPLTHQGGDGRLDNVAWFTALVELGPMGSVEYLVDPRHEQHQAAEDLAAVLLAYLRAGLVRQAI